MSAITGNYYLNHREALLKGFDEMFCYAYPLLVDAYGDRQAESIIWDSRREFDRLIPEIPFIGGLDNALTENLVMAAWFLAFFRAMEAQENTVGEAYEVIYGMVDGWLRRYPPSFASMMGALRLTPLYLDSLKKHANRSQQHEFPGDWVYTFVEGDGQTFDYGVEYTECGICKFYQEQGAEHLIPYMCALDFPLTRAYGLELKRTMTLGGGAARCDFRIKRRAVPETPDPSLQDMGVP